MKRLVWIVAVCLAVSIAAALSAALSFRERTHEIDRLIYSQCVANEQQDAVIVAQLEAAKLRAKSSLPADSPVLATQLQVLNDGILALEPPDEKPCQPPSGTEP